jgi:hypothetical protein
MEKMKSAQQIPTDIAAQSWPRSYKKQQQKRAFLVLAKFCGPVTVAKSEKGFAKPRLLAGQKYITLHGNMMSQA